MQSLIKISAIKYTKAASSKKDTISAETNFWPSLFCDCFTTYQMDWCGARWKQNNSSTSLTLVKSERKKKLNPN